MASVPNAGKRLAKQLRYMVNISFPVASRSEVMPIRQRHTHTHIHSTEFFPLHHVNLLNPHVLEEVLRRYAQAKLKTLLRCQAFTDVGFNIADLLWLKALRT